MIIESPTKQRMYTQQPISSDLIFSQNHNKFHTRQSTNFTTLNDSQDRLRNTRRIRIFNTVHPYNKQEENNNFCQLDNYASKTINSDSCNEDNKKTERFPQKQRKLNSYTSEEKLHGRRINRKCKIFEKNNNNYSQEANANNKQLRNNQIQSSSMGLPAQKIHSIIPITQTQGTQNIRFAGMTPQKSIFDQKYKTFHRLNSLGQLQAIHNSSAIRIHSTPTTIFVASEPVKLHSPTKIVFNYSNGNSVTQLIEKRAAQDHLAFIPFLPLNLSEENSHPNGRTLFPFAIDQKYIIEEDRNPAKSKIRKDSIKTTKIKNCSDSRRASDSDININWGNSIKNSMIKPNNIQVHFHHEPKNYMGSQISKLKSSKCKDSLIIPVDNQKLNKAKNADDYSNIEQDNSSGGGRYFDDDQELIPLQKQISYKNVDIEKEERDHQDDQNNNQNIFVDFIASHTYDRDRGKENNLVLEKTNHVIKHYDCEEIGKINKQTVKIQACFPILLIIFAILLLSIQIAM